jgi:LSD1 subclass zinc finger protein
MALPDRQLFALALASVITEMNGAHHDELGSWGLNEHTKPWCTNTLKNFYGIESKEDFDESARFFLEEGHSKAARDVLATLASSSTADTPKQALVRANAVEIQKVGLLAWDYGRLSAVVGWSYWAGFVDDPSAWKLLLFLASKVQSAYDSWSAYARAYELGRRFWKSGEPHEATARAIAKLLQDPESPWVKIPWNTNLGVTLPKLDVVARFKRSICPSCGAAKSRPSKTAYVYCDFCGTLADYDFSRACETNPDVRPGPAYAALAAELMPALDAAKARGDVAAYRSLQRRLFDGFCTHAPLSVPPRVHDPTYRAAYVAYMAEAATVVAFDPGSAAHDAAVARATSGLSFHSPRPGVLRVPAPAFEALAGAVFAQLAHHDALYRAKGIYELQPDAASRELQQRIGASLFTQGWLPMLDEAQAQKLLAYTKLTGEYLEAKPAAPTATACCGSCGASLPVFSGARAVVCESCGHKLDVSVPRVPCPGCGAPLAFESGTSRVACPSCRTEVSRVT